MAAFYLEPRLRPCYVAVYERDKERKGMINKVGEKKALFHCWEQASEVIGPSVMIGGHNGGTVSEMLAIVEDADGKVARVRPEDICFVDNKINEYAFKEE